jgi:plastocyanin
MTISKFLSVVLVAISFNFMSAQVEQIALEQTKGQFTQKSLELPAGEYQFAISNNAVGSDVGFVLVPKGQYDAANHIKAAYVTSPVKNNEKGMTGVVNLAAGEYEYFCPMNPTPKYSIMVRDDVETLNLTQVDGDFKVKGMTVSEGAYQFAVGNDGVDREVGFVLVPKGKYDPSMHIKNAYVKSTAAKGNTSYTNIVELKAGEYEYFCPLNPTPKYTLTVVK